MPKHVSVWLLGLLVIMVLAAFISNIFPAPLSTFMNFGIGFGWGLWGSRWCQERFGDRS